MNFYCANAGLGVSGLLLPKSKHFMKPTFCFLWLCMLATEVHGQSYTKWVVGDTADVAPTHYVGGIVLAGGGPDNDEAMRWMLWRAAGGDVVVLRASGSNGYNDYFYSQLGVPVNSVETIRFNSAQAAYDPYVIRQIRNAELVFIAGGDQYLYYQYWKDTPVEEALNYLLLEKKVTIGGTSAGMAILGQAYYTPSGGSLTSVQALANPFHPNFERLGNGGFLQTPFLAQTITDTHYDQRERAGRHFAFLARLAAEYGQPFYGIACNEYTVVCIDTAGKAVVYGDYPNYNDYAYFLKTNCQQPFEPEVLQPNTPLTWDRQQAAVIAYAVPGTPSGTHSFRLDHWNAGAGGNWQHWYATEGVFVQRAAPTGACHPGSSDHEPPAPSLQVKVYPNPAREYLVVTPRCLCRGAIQLQIVDALGREQWSYIGEVQPLVLNTGDWPAGYYTLIAHDNGQTSRTPIVLK